MANPIMSMLHQQMKPNPTDMISQFQQFRQQFTPENAKAIINQKLQSGEISQQQLDQAIERARGMMNLFR